MRGLASSIASLARLVKRCGEEKFSLPLKFLLGPLKHAQFTTHPWHLQGVRDTCTSPPAPPRRPTPAMAYAHKVRANAKRVLEELHHLRSFGAAKPPHSVASARGGDGQLKGVVRPALSAEDVVAREWSRCVVPSNMMPIAYCNCRPPNHDTPPRARRKAKPKDPTRPSMSNHSQPPPMVHKATNHDQLPKFQHLPLPSAIEWRTRASFRQAWTKSARSWAAVPSMPKCLGC